MDSAPISALAAMGGALIGGVTSFAASWLTQQTQVKAQQLAHNLSKRERIIQKFYRRSVKVICRLSGP